MVASVAGQGPTAGGASSASSFFQQKPIVTVVGGALHVNKSALATRAKSAPGVVPDEDGLFLRVIAAIRAFLAKICRAILPAKFFSSPVSDNSRQDAAIAPASDRRGPVLSETEEDMVVDGLPESTLDRTRQTIDEMIAVALGDTLPNSLKSALAMPDLGRRQAFRVLLQQNVGDTQQLRDVRKDLRSSVEQMIGPFADAHGIDKESALALFRADLDNGGGVIANRVDPNSEIRGHVAELKRLDSALAALAIARGTICTRAMEARSYAREELAVVIAQKGLDTEFLYKAEAVAASPAAPQPVVRSSQSGNVVAMADFRQTSSVSNEQNPVDYTPAEHAGAGTHVKDAIATLVEHGVIENGIGADTLARAATVDAALSDESEFETEVQGDDLGDFLKKGHNLNAAPKP